MIMKNFKLSSLFIYIALTISSFSFGQSEEIINENLDSIKIKRVNIGLKIGIPNIVGGSAELTLPIFDNRISPYFDYSGFNLEADEIETNFSYFEYVIV